MGELKEECKTLGLPDKGKKAELIERIREAQATTAEPVEEAAEETAVEESTPEDAAAEDASTEEAIAEEEVAEEAVAEEAVAEEAATEEPVAEEAAAEEPAAEEAAAEETVIEESVEEEEDGPLEDWTVKELKEECKTLGIADKGKKAELIARIKEFRSSSMEVAVEASEDGPVIEEIAEKEVVAEEAPVEEAPVEEAPVEEALVEAPVEESTVEETPVGETPVEEAIVEETTVEATPVEEEPVDETPVAEAPVEEATEETTTDETESQSAGLDPSSISELLAKNEQGQLSQQEFFRIFLVSVQNSLTTNQRLADVEKKLDETAERLEKIEVAADSVSNATTEPETHIEETEEAPVVEAETVAEEPAVEESAADPREETDITSLVENAEKLQPRISRKRAHVSGHQKKSARAKRTRV